MQFKRNRLAAKLTQEEAAKYLGVTRRTIINYEKGNAPQAAVIALSWLAGTADAWNGYYFEPEYITTPSGDRINKNVINNMEYYGYLNQLIGQQKPNKQVISQGKAHTVELPANDSEISDTEQLNLRLA